MIRPAPRTRALLTRAAAGLVAAVTAVAAALVAVSTAAFADGPGDPPAPSIGADHVRQTARSILRRAEFQRPPKTLLQRAEDELGKLLRRLLDALGRLTSGTWGWVFVAALVAGLAAVGYFVVRRLQRDPGRDPGGVAVEGPRRPAADWRREAEACEARGDWRGALRAYWRSSVADLADRGLVEEIPGRTTGEYRREVRASVPAGSAAFDEATRAFEDAWYAASDVGPDDVARARAALGHVLPRVRV